jgi:rRNA-processing protein EBP2
MSDDDDDDNDDDGELPPESEWNKEALALKAAIEAGTFDAAVLQSNNDNDDGSSFEEVDLESDDDEDEEQIDESGEHDDLIVAENNDDDIADDVDDDDDDEGDDVDDDVDDNDDEEDDDDAVDEDEEEIDDVDFKNKSSNGVNMDCGADTKVDDDDDDNEEKDEDDEDEHHALVKTNETRAKALQVVTASLLAEKKNWDWSETFDIVPPTPLPFNKEVVKATSGVSATVATTTVNPLGIHDDLQREVAFYDVALEAVLEAKILCHKAGIPFTRPDDFFAEMVKTDGM